MTPTPTFAGLDCARVTRAEVEVDGLIDQLSTVLAREAMFTAGVEAAWAGSDSAAFTHGWRSLDRPAIGAVVATLTEVRDELARNRQHQDHTSRSTGGPPGRVGPAGGGSPRQAGGAVGGGLVDPDPLDRDQTDTVDDGDTPNPDDRQGRPTVLDTVFGGLGEKIGDELRDLARPVLEYLQGAPPLHELFPFLVPPPELAGARRALQAGDGRRHLTDAQFGLLLQWDPVLLLGLDDLTDAERALVHQAIIDRYEGRLPLAGVDTTAGIEVDTLVFEFGVELSGQTVVHLDGSVEVTLALSGELGVELGERAVEVEAGVEVGGELVYRFASSEEAAAFLAGLYDEATDMNPFNVVDYLEEAGPESAVVMGGIAVEFEGDVHSAEGELRVAAGGGYDFVNDETFVYLDGELGIEVAGMGSLGADVSLVATIGDDGIDRVEIDATLGGDSEALADMLGLPAGTSLGGEVWVEGDLDLSDPASAAAWEDFVGGTGSFAEVINASDLVIGVDTTQSSSSEHDWLVVEVEVETTVSENVVTYIKPPFSYGMLEVPPPGFTVSPVELIDLP